MLRLVASDGYHGQIEEPDGDRLAIAELACQGEHAMVERLGLIELTLGAVQLPESIERSGDFPRLAQCFRQSNAFFETPACVGRVALAKIRHAERLQDDRDAPLVIDLPRDSQAFLEVTLRFGIAAHEKAELARIEQRAAAPQVSWRGADTLEGLHGEAEPELQKPPVQPVRAQGIGEPQARCRAVARAIARDVRGEEILALHVEAR